MFASLALCFPLDFVNTFDAPARTATAGVILLAVWSASLLLLPRLRNSLRHSRFAWVLRGTGILAAIGDFGAIAVAIWIWLQARAFTTWCAPQPGMAAEWQRAQLALQIGPLVLTLAVIFIVGSGLALGTAAISRHNRKRELAVCSSGTA